jgi:hypothetical protein
MDQVSAFLNEVEASPSLILRKENAEDQKVSINFVFLKE